MPFTLTTLVACLLVFVLFWLTSSNLQAVEFFEGFAYNTEDGLAEPWTLVTYGLLNPDPWLLLAVSLLLYYFTGALERIWGTRKIALFFLSVVLLIPLLYWFVDNVTGQPSRLYSLLIVVTATLVAWAGLYPRQSVMLWAIIPIQSRWIALIASVMVVAYQGFGKPMYGVVVAVVLAAVYAYSVGLVKLPAWKSTGAVRSAKPGESRTYDLKKRTREEQEKLRLKELFERSFWDDDDQHKLK
jgi:membrane associated rhomboid family serine protease